MYLHIGNKQSVKKKDIIGIFDLDTSTVTKTGKDFINGLERAGKVEYADDDLPRSFVLVSEGDECRVKLSRISSKGLLARTEDGGYDKE
ncbi:MAG: DUF370 domain-containing protein [Clostridia bacterium]|nr:DUF370 domain-containing protein [Clostridia bacterium]